MTALNLLVDRFHGLAYGRRPMTIRDLAHACVLLLDMINLLGVASTESWVREITTKVSLRVESSPLIWEFIEHI